MSLSGLSASMPTPGATTAVSDNPRDAGKGMPLGGNTVQQDPSEEYTGPKNILLGNVGDLFGNMPTYEYDPTANPYGPDDRPNPNYVPKENVNTSSGLSMSKLTSPFTDYGRHPLDGFLDHYRQQTGMTQQESRDRANADLARRGLPPLSSRPRQYSPVYGQYGMAPQPPAYQQRMFQPSQSMFQPSQMMYQPPMSNPFFQGLGGYMMPQPYNPYAQMGYGAQSLNPYGIRALYNMFR